MISKKIELNPNCTFELLFNGLGIIYKVKGKDIFINKDTSCSFLKEGQFYNDFSGKYGSGGIMKWYLRHIDKEDNKPSYIDYDSINTLCGFKTQLDNEIPALGADKTKEIKKILLPNYEQFSDKSQGKFGGDYDDIFKEIVACFKPKDINNCPMVKYITKRGINLETVGVFNLGYSNIKDLNEFHNRFKKFDSKRLVESGLFNAKGYFKFCYQKRLVIPYYNEGVIVCLQFRLIQNVEDIKLLDDECKSRYSINTKINEETGKESVIKKIQNLIGFEMQLFNITKSIENLKQKDKIFICEGAIDVISATQLGYKAFGLPSAGLVNKLLDNKVIMDKLVSLDPIIVLAMDKDGAGQTNQKKVETVLLSLGLEIHEVILDQGLDINDALVKGDTELKTRLIIGDTHSKKAKISLYDEFVKQTNLSIFIQSAKGVSISYNGLNEFINYLGFCYIPNTNLDDRQKSIDESKYYRNIDNILTSAGFQDIFESVIKELQSSISLGDQSHIITESLRRQKTTLFGGNRLLDINRLEFNYEKLSGKIRVKGFKNCVLILDLINKKPMTLTYQELKHNDRYKNIYIFESEITKRNFNLVDIAESDFTNLNYFEITQKYFKETTTFKFLRNIIDKNGSNLEVLNKSFELIGYVNRGYHPSINRKLIFLVDGEETEVGSNLGRRGKTLLLKLLLCYNKGQFIQANNPKLLEDKFNFGSFDPFKHALLTYNDVDGSKVSMRDFYTLSDGIRVEKKGKDAFELLEQLMPVIVITCNHLPTFKQSETSTLDRISLIEFSRYYSPSFDPVTEFKERLGEWEEDSKWNEFYSTMATLEYKYRLQESSTDTLKYQPNHGLHAFETSLKARMGSDNTEFLIDRLLNETALASQANSIEVVVEYETIKKLQDQLYGEPNPEERNKSKLLKEFEHAKTIYDNIMESSTVKSMGWERLKDNNGKVIDKSQKLYGATKRIKVYVKTL